MVTDLPGTTPEVRLADVLQPVNDENDNVVENNEEIFLLSFLKVQKHNKHY